MKANILKPGDHNFIEVQRVETSRVAFKIWVSWIRNVQPHLAADHHLGLGLATFQHAHYFAVKTRFN
jgi:hypothetical protein